MNCKNDMGNAIFKLMLRQNLGCIARFHDYIDDALRATLIDEDADSSSVDKAYLRINLEKHFPEKLRETSFLLMFGHLEEMLYLLWRDKNPRSVQQDGGYGIKKFKSYIKDILGELGDNSTYSIIINAQEVRNALLHIAGRVPLSKHKDALKRVAISHPDSYKIENDRIRIELSGLLEFRNAISNLTEEIHNKSICT